ncbi:MAG TPA: hypothetical protein VHJ20_14595 [Polyangia bacterium]|nr:hypothetical protein [Polyangia bacterium]
MEPLIRRLRETPVKRWVLYFVVYCSVGSFLQLMSPQLRIAAFRHDWQVFTLYGLYLVPLSILLRERSWHVQYAYAVVAIAPCDVVGFALGTSFAYPGNVIEHVFGPRSFTLVFVLLAGVIPLGGNAILAWLEAVLWGRREPRPLIARRTIYAREVLHLASLEGAAAAEPERSLPTAWP